MYRAEDCREVLEDVRLERRISIESSSPVIQRFCFRLSAQQAVQEQVIEKAHSHDCMKHDSGQPSSELLGTPSAINWTGERGLQPATAACRRALEAPSCSSAGRCPKTVDFTPGHPLTSMHAKRPSVVSAVFSPETPAGLRGEKFLLYQSGIAT